MILMLIHTGIILNEGEAAMLQSKYFRTCLAIIAFLTILYLGSKVIFLFTPVVAILNLLLVPMMLSGFMYYLLRPLVSLWSAINWDADYPSC